MRIRGVYLKYGIAYSPDIGHPRAYYEIFDELRDVGDYRSRRFVQSVAPNRPVRLEVTTIHSDSVAARSFGGTLTPAPYGFAESLRERLELGPERLMLTLAAASDLRYATDTSIQGIRHDVVTARNGRLRVYISRVTQLPTLVEQLAHHGDDTEWSTWGDTRSRTWYSSWSRERGGVRYPRTWNVERNGLRHESVAINELDVAAPIVSDSFAISDTLRRAYAAGRSAPVGRQPGQLPIDVADGVVFVPGQWNVMLVRQGNDIIIIDAPHSAQYSRRVINEAEGRFTGAKVRALVTTDFMWAHLAGVREYVARAIPVYAHARNGALLRAMARAPHRLVPDSLSRVRRGIELRPVSRDITIGTGNNRFVLIPADASGGDYGRRMLLAYFPAHRLLYVSDMYAPRGEPAFTGQGAAEIAEIISAHKLDVATVLGMHLSPAPLSQIVGGP